MKGKYNMPWPPRKVEGDPDRETKPWRVATHKAWNRRISYEDSGKDWEWYFKMRQDAKDGKYG